MVPCETWAAAAISRWESPSRPARVIACSYSLSASRFALGGALDTTEDVGAQLVAGAVLPHPLGGGDRAEPGAGADSGAGSVGDAPGVLVHRGGVVTTLSAEPVRGGSGDRVQFRRHGGLGLLAARHPRSFARGSKLHDAGLGRTA